MRTRHAAPHATGRVRRSLSPGGETRCPFQWCRFGFCRSGTRCLSCLRSSLMTSTYLAASARNSSRRFPAEDGGGARKKLVSATQRPGPDGRSRIDGRPRQAQGAENGRLAAFQDLRQQLERAARKKGKGGERAIQAAGPAAQGGRSGTRSGSLSGGARLQETAFSKHVREPRYALSR